MERSHRTIGNIVRAIVSDSPGQTWPDAIPSAQLAINSAPNDHHGLSPFEVNFGHLPQLPVDRHLPTASSTVGTWKPLKNLAAPFSKEQRFWVASLQYMRYEF